MLDASGSATSASSSAWCARWPATSRLGGVQLADQRAVPGARRVLRGARARRRRCRRSTELEQLWFEMQREMTESGRGCRASRPRSSTPDGAPLEAEVVRIGRFIAMTDGALPATICPASEAARRALAPARRSRVPARRRRSWRTRRRATSKAAVDPSRGVLLSLLVQRPNVMERIEKGEAVGYVIIVVGVDRRRCSRVYQ